jgi:DNA-binding transcriptional regulator GbsR (MarR family)
VDVALVGADLRGAAQAADRDVTGVGGHAHARGLVDLDRAVPLFMQQGLPKMMARVLTCLFTADAGSLTASELVQHLQVSPASVSKAIAFLEDQGLIRRERDERRRERYFVDDDVWYQSTIASARGIAQVADTARQGVGILGRDTPAAARLENIARFSDFISESILRAAEQAREVLHTKPEASSGGTAKPSSDRGVDSRLDGHSQWCPRRPLQPGPTP